MHGKEPKIHDSDHAKVIFIVFLSILLAYKDQEFLNSKDGYRKQMITYREQDQSWKPSLILPKGVCFNT